MPVIEPVCAMIYHLAVSKFLDSRKMRAHVMAPVGQAYPSKTVAPDGHVGIRRLALHDAVRSGGLLEHGVWNDGIVGHRVDTSVEEDGQPLRLQHVIVRIVLCARYPGAYQVYGTGDNTTRTG